MRDGRHPCTVVIGCEQSHGYVPVAAIYGIDDSGDGTVAAAPDDEDVIDVGGRAALAMLDAKAPYLALYTIRVFV